MHNLIILSLFLIFALIAISTGILMRFNKKDFLGKTPINRSLYFIGKVSMGLSWAFLIAQAAKINTASFPVPTYLSWLGTIIFTIASIFVTSSFYELGLSNRFGIPKEKITLKKNGIYNISRNPMYVGFYLMCIASCIYAPSPLNLFFSLIGIFIHYKIVVAEEDYLEQEFRHEWLEYKNKVRRYV
jgi:protein-S-isoprenylcysteine O-methyltransferase Ste14